MYAKITSTLLISCAAVLALTPMGATTLPLSPNSPPPQILAQRQQTLLGSWTITEAKTPTGDEYTGNLEIETSGDAEDLYRITWDTSNGNYSGLGFYQDGRLLVGYGLNNQVYGVAAYRINRDGTLDGKWAFSEIDGKIGLEKASGGTPGRLEGEYRIQGTDPGITDMEDEVHSYSGSLQIRKARDTYQVSWRVGQQIYMGVGLRVDDWLIVGWGPGDGFAAIDYRLNGNRATGRWAMSGNAKLGEEKLIFHSN